jgi:hypothetical protein
MLKRIFLLTIIILGCTDNQPPKLFITTSEVLGMGDNEKRTDTTTQVVSDYFEVHASRFNDGSYEAGKHLIEPQSLEDFPFVNVGRLTNILIICFS